MKSPLLKYLALTLSCLAWGCRDYGVSPVSGTPVSTVPPPPVTAGPTVSFSSTILPVLEHAGCVACHGGTNGLTVSSVAALLRGGIHGPAIVPGNADASLMVRKISPSPPFGDRMPQGGPYLPDSTIQTIKQWINDGAPDN